MTYQRDIIIEKGHPIPTKSAGGAPETTWLHKFMAMEVGDSFACADRAEAVLCKAALKWYRRPDRLEGRKFLVAKPEHKARWRCWRVE